MESWFGAFFRTASGPAKATPTASTSSVANKGIKASAKASPSSSVSASPVPATKAQHQRVVGTYTQQQQQQQQVARDGVDEKLSRLSSALTEVRHLAVAMGDVLDEQNGKIDEISDTVEVLTARTSRLNNRMDKLM